MDTPLTDLIVAQLGENTESIAIVNGFKEEWETQIRDAFEAGMQGSWNNARCLDANEYLQNNFNIEI